MHILLAGPRGFCAGVNMAIESLRRALERFGPPVYVLHEIVHNKWVVEQFRAAGAVFVDDVEQAPPGSVLLYSAHGVSPQVRQAAAARRLMTIDATCPLVTKVHKEVRQFAQQGYTIVLIGHGGHDEVVGTMGEAPEAIRLVQTPADVDRLVIEDPEKVAYVTQTTLSLDDAAAIITRLRQRFPAIRGPAQDDICYATQNRQHAVRWLAAQADFVLVVGSQNSSNSQRLAEIARQTGVPARLVDGPEQIDLGWFSGGERVVITAGASAPELLVQKCVQLLEERFSATVECCNLRSEQVVFPLPEPLR
jgi:4-hydroxy-3-methylbut-2-enyl diphosphate reductase